MRWAHALLLLFSALLARAIEVKLDQTDENRQQCSGMYSKKSWGGSVDPFILVKFLKDKIAEEKGEDPVVSLLIFEWQDKQLLGKPADADYMDRKYICDDDAVAQNYCNTSSLGQFILADDAEKTSKRVIRTEAIHIAKTDRLAVNYPIEKTGYYCVETFAPEGQEYTAISEFRNAYGELPAAQIAKLPFYGGMALVYAVISIFWGFLYVQHRHDILAVQNYITAILVFLVVEMLMTWGFYDYQNRHGNNVGNKVFMIIVSILNAGRNSFSFFLLLIVCMGYGVVKHTLGKTMLYVRWLAVAHFVFGVIYAIASLTIRPDDAGPLVLLVILPLSATLTAFYIWTLNSLNMTMKDLVDRKQRVKFMMYKKLWWCILGSILVIFGFFFFNSFAFAGAGDPDFAPTHWQTRWFVLDGWLNLVYLADVCFVAYLWRPTANNRRFAMSDEIAQDDEGFEIASLRDSLDEEDRGPNDPPAYDPAPTRSNISGPDRTESPLPAPKPQRPSHLPRESLDGDTIFAVGDDDKWSDDDLDSQDGGRADGKGEERQRLTG
ncbi:Transmembrane receptor eukaryota [Macrophomina phaseolina MS6]|uniref:Transmembrane receptor eukaryota n=2 Tax=Macrophomina phaseolina TaxID=35725 RepID=K2SFR8_MACPH|nr:Transmembrane receptor eukaryota [Macrophomina phaseolina MS6]KAH7036353.1 lung seven transmembrane receptor-domain-containing protein [Macrophomina phaseolina]